MVCKVSQDNIVFYFGGDCFAIIKTRSKFYCFYCGFDEAAFQVEDEANKAYAEYLRQAGGNKELAWDLYWPEYRAKRVLCANKNVGKGGYATLNGDPALENCWGIEKIDWSCGPEFILLGTDGMLPSNKTNPKDRKLLAEELGSLYLQGGLLAILKWRDESEESLHYITGWPEATAVELHFS